MQRRRKIAGLALGAFSSALTVLPWLHTLHHRDDHVHVDGAIVFIHDEHHQHDEDHHAGEHDEEDDHDDEGEDYSHAGLDHPEHHGPHGRGALAHGAAFILDAPVFVLPQPAVALELVRRPPPRDRVAGAPRRSPRVTRGPPLTPPSSVITLLNLVASSVG